MKLSDPQKDALYDGAVHVMIAIVKSKENHDEAWNAYEVRGTKATLRVLREKDLIMENNHLTMKGIATAKEIYSETFPEKGDWDTEVASSVIEQKELEMREESERKEWKEWAASLSVPEGYQPPICTPWRIEWRTVDWAYAPSISIDDRNAPFSRGEKRYKPCQWEMTFSTGSGMDNEAVRIFKQALDFASIVLAKLEARHANEEVTPL